MMKSDKKRKDRDSDGDAAAEKQRKAEKKARKAEKKAKKEASASGEEAPPTPGQKVEKKTTTTTTTTLVKVPSVEDFRKEHSIEIKFACDQTRLLEPFTSFDDAAFPKALRSALKAQGYAAPTPIQAEAWPIL